MCDVQVSRYIYKKAIHGMRCHGNIYFSGHTLRFYEDFLTTCHCFDKVLIVIDGVSKNESSFARG